MDPPQPAAIPVDPPVSPTSITPATTASELSPVNHLAPVANPIPTQQPTPHHPPYAEMITAAISALKERNGSSKIAIAKYIDRAYTNLPSTHAALLTHHLKRLKNSGHIVMVKKSYKLPSRSAVATSLSPAAGPLDNATATTIDTADLTSASPFPAQTKKRGRPRKPKSLSAPQAQSQAICPAHNYIPISGPDQYQCQSYDVGPGVFGQNVAVGPFPVSEKRGPGRPKKNNFAGQSNVGPPVAQNGLFFSAEAQNITLPPAVAPIPPATQAAVDFPMMASSPASPPVALGNGGLSGSEAMFVSLGLSDSPLDDHFPSKRGPGRPRKSDSAGQQQPRRKAVSQNGPKKSPGRPKKNGPTVVPREPGLYPVQVPMAAPGPAPATALYPALALGKPRGRSKGDASASAQNGSLNGQQQLKKRGRKPKQVELTAAGAVSVPVQGSSTGGVMMQPPFSQGVNAASDGNALMQVPVSDALPQVGKKQGRQSTTRTGGLKKPRKLTGKPLGRPKKNASGGGNSSLDTLNLKSKLAYLQSRIKETVSVIKPCINRESAGDAMGALQQLEDLASVDLNAPVHPQSEQQQPAQQVQ